MATAFISDDGSYSEKSKDGNTQASNKFSNPSQKPTDNMEKPTNKGQAPVAAQKRR